MAASRKSRAKAKGRREHGGFIGIPHNVANHGNFIGLSPRATKLLIDLLSQYRGFNNGDMSAAWSLMQKRNWSSRDQLFKAQSELESKGFILKSRQGGRNRCNLWAVTWLAVDECKGKLDIRPTSTPSNDWKNCLSYPPQGQSLPAISVSQKNGATYPQGLTRHKCKSGSFHEHH